MAKNEEQLTDFLKSCGYAVQFADVAGFSDIRFARVDHMGITLGVALIKDEVLVVETGFAYVPRQNVAPLFRRLLAHNRSMTVVKFALREQDGSLSLKADRPIAGLDASELKAILDHVGTYYWRHIPGLVEEFQLPVLS